MTIRGDMSIIWYNLG